MNSDHKRKGNNEIGVELKYCEHCGGLWVRERGAGVYCDLCQAKVADLPEPAVKRRKPALEVRPHPAVEDFGFEIELEDLTDFEAAGGVA
jgi:hypothetical protein